MSMQRKVRNKPTPLELRITTLEEEHTKVVVDTEAMGGVKEHLAEVEDGSYAVIMDRRVTSHETIRRLHVPIVKLPIMLLKTAQYY